MKISLFVSLGLSFKIYKEKNLTSRLSTIQLNWKMFDLLISIEQQQQQQQERDIDTISNL
jgi:hypothetical protein